MPKDLSLVLKNLSYEIRRCGFLSEAQIIFRAIKLDKNIDVKKVLRVLCKDNIHKVKYTNMYVSFIKEKTLYYYNPNKGKK